MYAAKSKLGLSDALFGSALVQIGGVTSVKKLDKDGFEAMLGFFEYMGLAQLRAKGQNHGERDGMTSFRQIELIRTLCQEYTRAEAGEDELNKWMERCL